MSLASKPMYDNGKDEKIVGAFVKGFITLVFALVLYFGFFKHEPLGIDNDTLYKALHPYHPIKDTLGLLGYACISFLLSGWVKWDFLNPKAENTVGPIRIFAAVAAVLIILMFV